MITITMGFTPDPDDAFAAYALVAGRIKTPDLEVRYITRPIEELNCMAARNELDVAAISSVFYPSIHRDYRILRVGASVGRGYGPLVAAREPYSLEELAERTIAVPGNTTTGANLLRLFQSRAKTVAMPFDQIRAAICRGEVEAGVLIHEELLASSESGLHRVACLGEKWLCETGLPLPVGLNVIRRELGDTFCRRFASYLRESIAYAIARPEEAFEWASQYARSTSQDTAWRFTEMFANHDTLEFGPDCERGLRLLLRRLHDSGLAPRAPEPSFVEPFYETFPSALFSGGVSS